MPECKFGLNDRLVLEKESAQNGGQLSAARSSGGGGGKLVDLDDCSFHQCVKLNDYDTTRTM